MSRRVFATFSLSFIDAILCGFGAVILLFLIVNANTLAHRKEVTEDLRGEADRLEQRVTEGRRRLVELRNTLERRIEEQRRYQGLAREAVERLQRSETQLARLDKDNLARREHVNRLKSDLKSVEQGAKRLEAGASTDRVQGDRVREHRGEGQRQYLTGLALDGKRTLILLDASASMLEERLIDIIRTRNLPDAEKRRAPKWRRTLATLDWISTQLPMDGRFQLYAFNESASPVIAGTAGKWLDAGDPAMLDKAVERARALAPEKGTNLYRAFAVARNLKPRPDTLLLLTDGLPTQGKKTNRGKTVSGAQRLEHFSKAVEALPRGVPVNIILFPMEGDPMAAPSFWRLAQSTQGAFFSPSKDWP